MAYCVPDSIALLVRKDKEAIREFCARRIGRVPDTLYSSEYLPILYELGVENRLGQNWDNKKWFERPTLKQIIVRNFKRGPYLIGFVFGKRYRYSHLIYVDGGMIYCNGFDRPVWYTDYKLYRTARVHQTIVQDGADTKIVPDAW